MSLRSTLSPLLPALLPALLLAGCSRSPAPAAPTSSAPGGDQAGADAPPAALDPAIIRAGTGAEPTTKDDGTVRVGWARDDVEVTVDGTPFPAAAGLGSWAGFVPADGGAMVMGDTVVFQDEVSPAMDAAFAHGLTVTALHNHFFFDEPKVYFMHIGGHGDPADLARGVGAVWNAIREVRAASPQPAESFGPVPAGGGQLDPAALATILGAEPAAAGEESIKFSFAREATMHGARFAGSMGLSSWVAFTGSDRSAAIDGDFAMTADEVQPVLRAMRANGIHVVALHNHMIGEEPAYFFTHFWARGEASELAAAFRAVLDAQRQAAPHHGAATENDSGGNEAAGVTIAEQEGRRKGS